MIDIHCHLLYGLDDGAPDADMSVAMLREAAKQGVTAVILTPHYRHGMFHFDAVRTMAHLRNLLPEARKLRIDLAVGTEYHVNSGILDALQTGKVFSLAKSSYVLTEYSYESEYRYIREMTQTLVLRGYIPVIAHAERYACMVRDIELARELRELGAWIQINCDAVTGADGRGAKKYCRQLLDLGYADVIASDSHGIKNRACHMKKCHTYLSCKYSEALAEKLMTENPAKILLDGEVER